MVLQALGTKILPIGCLIDTIRRLLMAQGLLHFGPVSTCSFSPETLLPRSAYTSVSPTFAGGTPSKMKRFALATALAAALIPIIALRAVGPFEAKLPADRQIVHVLNRLTFGPRPG